MIDLFKRKIGRKQTCMTIINLTRNDAYRQAFISFLLKDFINIVIKRVLHKAKIDIFVETFNKISIFACVIFK